MASVDILLATYNGAEFLPELLQSLEAQTHRDWRLIVRDDGSTDATLEIIEKWSDVSGRPVTVLQDGDSGLGAKANFSRLLAASDRPYFMFCDQDDVWLPEKVSLSLDEIRLAEHKLGGQIPVLVHCDLTIVDEKLRIIDESFWTHQDFKFTQVEVGWESERARKSLLIRNFVTGCAMMGNAALRDAANPVPLECVMHDWWLALIAAHLGEIRKIDRQCILYRQHSSNTLGAKGWSIVSILRRVLPHPGAAINRTRGWVALSRSQARELSSRLNSTLSTRDSRYIEEYAHSEHAGFIPRKTFMFRHGVSPQSHVRSLIMFLFM